MSDFSFDIGRHEQAIQQLLANDEKMMTQLGNIETTLAEQRGGRRVAIWLAGALGGAMGFLFKVGTALGGRHA